MLAGSSLHARLTVRHGGIPSLDGIRAVAVGIVFLSHVGYERVIPGNFGVTLFFVLSGFLITTLMREEVAGRGTISFKAFYLRRVLRLLPPLLAVIALALALQALGLVVATTSIAGVSAILGYYSNYFIIQKGYVGMPAGLSVTWSLAVEEHYYLLFPPLALWLLRRRSRRCATLVLGGLCLAVAAWRCLLQWWIGVSGDHLKMATDTRMDSILFGCLLAFVANPWLEASHSASLSRKDILLLIASLLLLLFTFIWRNETFRNTFRYSLQCIALLPLFWLCVARTDHFLFRWLSWRPLVYIGGISYTLYLCDQLVVFTIQHEIPLISRPWLAVTTILASIAVAEPIRRFVEVPSARLRRRLHNSWIEASRDHGAAADGYPLHGNPRQLYPQI